MTATALVVTKTGGRDATTRHIPPKLALAVGLPSTPTPRGWQWSALTDLARLESGHTPSRRHPEYWDGSIPWISIQDAKVHHCGRIHQTIETTNEFGIANSSARLLPENTVCLSRTASVGYVVVMGRPMATSQDFVNWICSIELNADFLKYLLISEGKQILRFASGSVHPTIYFPEVKAFYICHPSLTEQQRIVRILDKAFDGIATAKANAGRNLQNARALFESNLQSAFTQHGQGWNERRLGDIADVQSGGTPPVPVKEYWSGEIPWYSSGELNDLFTTNPERQITNAGLQNSNAKLFPNGSLLIGMYDTAALKMSILDRDGAFNQAIAGVRPNDAIEMEFLFHAINAMKPMLLLQRRGVRQKNLSLSKIKEIGIPIPKRCEQKAIVSSLRAIAWQTKRLESLYQRKIATLDELKKSILHQAFTGQL
jgi:type I restriction enzyme, S subunit